MPVSTRMPVPSGNLSSCDGAGRGREAVVGVLGVEAGLDGVTELGRAVAGQRLAVGDEDLQLHQVDAGGVPR